MKNKLLKTLICATPIISGSILTLPMVSCGSVKTLDIVGDDQININEKKQYKAIVNGKDCNNVKWNVVSADQGQASIDEEGVLTGKVEGTVTIMVTYTKNGIDHLGFKNVEVTNDIKPIPFEYLDIGGSRLQGFNDKATKEALSQYNTLLIPSYVTTIGDYIPEEERPECDGQVFCRDVDGDGVADTSLIPDNIVNLRFETDENGMSALELIGARTFLFAPIKSIVFPISASSIGLTIQYQAFKGIGLEQCYFAQNTREIEEEAFMNTKLEEVVFHNTEVGSLDPNQPPWLRKGQTINNGYVRSIGLHAFSGCPVKYHKVCVAPTSSNEVYKIDENGYGPFANIESPIPFSNIEFLDISDYHNDGQTLKSLPSDCIKTFGINMNSTETEAITGHYVLYDDRDVDITFINKIRSVFKLPPTGIISPTMIGNWNFVKATQFNFSPTGVNLYQPITWTMHGDYSTLSLNSFYEITDASVFPTDLQATFNNVEWSDGKSSGRQLYIEVEKDTLNNLILKCKTDEDDALSGLDVSFDVTFYSPSLHMSYTYGHHEQVVVGETAIDNHMIAQF